MRVLSCRGTRHLVLAVWVKDGAEIFLLPPHHAIVTQPLLKNKEGNLNTEYKYKIPHSAKPSFGMTKCASFVMPRNEASCIWLFALGVEVESSRIFFMCFDYAQHDMKKNAGLETNNPTRGFARVTPVAKLYSGNFIC